MLALALMCQPGISQEYAGAKDEVGGELKISSVLLKDGQSYSRQLAIVIHYLRALSF